MDISFFSLILIKYCVKVVFVKDHGKIEMLCHICSYGQLMLVNFFIDVKNVTNMSKC